MSHQIASQNAIFESLITCLSSHSMTINLTHRIIIIAISLFFVPSRAAAQELLPPAPPPPIYYPNDNTIAVTPAMAIIFACIIATFFLMGCLSVYTRSCIDYGSAVDGTAAILGFFPSTHVVDGLDPSVLGSFPTLTYSEVKGLKIGKGGQECAVCLSEFEDTDTLRLLPMCSHVFHQNCIDVWLDSKITCPVCRAVLIPRPGETSNFVLPVREAEAEGTAEDDIIIEIEQTDNTSPITKETLPPRSTSRKKRSFGKFKRSFTTGHVAVQPGDEHERFTLRLPEEVQNKLVSRSLGQAKGGVLFTRLRSKRNGYRSATVGATKGRSLMNYERFEEEGRQDRWRFMRIPSVVSRSGSVQSPHWFKPQLQRMTGETSDPIKEDVEIGERSFHKLLPDGGQL